MKISNRVKAIGDFLYIYKYLQTFVNDRKYLYRIHSYIYELAVILPNDNTKRTQQTKILNLTDKSII